MIKGLLIYGISGNGKTYVTRKLSKDFGFKKVEFDYVISIITEIVRAKFAEEDPKVNLRSDFIGHLDGSQEDFVPFKTALEILVSKNDEFFKEFYEKQVKEKKPQAYYELNVERSSCVDLGKNGMFLKPLADDIMIPVFRYLIKNSSFFFIEGYYFKDEKFKDSLKKRCEAVNYLECFYKDRKDSYIYKLDDQNVKDLEALKKEVKKIIGKRPPYQIFSEKGVGDSKSYEKLQKLGMPENLSGKNVLDIGCNEGFYCFECERRGAKCVGIEKDPYWYNEAKKKKGEFSSFVNFINDSWDSLPSLHYKFDLVLFFAAFHYIKDNQLEVLTNIFNRLNKNGTLILEIGLLDKEDGKFLIENVKRPAGDVCQFTNKFTIEKLLHDAGFGSVVFHGKGWDIRGDDVPRYVIHAKKIEKKVATKQEPDLSTSLQSVTKKKKNASLLRKKDIDCDIIIVTRNGLEYTKKCVESIKKNTSDVNYRIIFIDNNSTDETLGYLKTIENSILISNSQNLGFIKAMNQGFEKVKATYTVWLNNDTIVTPHWLYYLIEHVENNPKAAAIGPVSNGTGIIQKVENFEHEPTLEKINDFGRILHTKNSGSVIEYHRIAGFCIVMKSELISKIGKLDEGFGMGGYDDDDYCRRIRNVGYKVLIAEDVFIYHKSGVSFSLSGDPDLQLPFLIQKNRQKFLDKWVGIKSNLIEQKNQPLVSIVMPTKDREYIIPRAIRSIIEQTYKNWELLVINDGGKDIKHVIDEFADSRIKYINLEKNYGKSYANNFGIKKSGGKIIAYLDDDDILHPNHLELSVSYLLKYPSRHVVYSDYIKVHSIPNKTGVYFPLKKEVVHIKDAKYDTFNEMNLIPNFCLVHLKSVFKKIEKYDESLEYYEDWDFIRRLSKQFYFIHIPQITGEYWAAISGETRNLRALIDPNLVNINEYIKNKKTSSQDSILQTDELADKMVNRKELGKAFEKYQAILETDPEYIPALEGAADRKFTLRKYEDSTYYWKKLLQYNPNNLYYYNKTAQVFLFSNNYQGAKEIIEYALAISDDKNNYFILQQCYRNLNNKITSKFIQKKVAITAENINFHEVEQFLLDLYNKSTFHRKLLVLGYKILKKLSKI